MAKRTYTMEFQRLLPSKGYTSCLEHQASRCVILEITSFPAKRGRRPYRVTRNYAIFSGSAMRLRAQALLDRLVASTRAKPARQPGIWGRSLTTEEFDASVRAGLTSPPVRQR